MWYMYVFITFLNTIVSPQDCLELAASQVVGNEIKILYSKGFAVSKVILDIGKTLAYKTACSHEIKVYLMLSGW